MVESAVLTELSIKRRKLENEVVCLCQKEVLLKCELKKLEEKIIIQLQESIKAIKLALSGLESQKNCLEEKLGEMQGNPVVLLKPEEQPAKSEGSETVQKDTNEEDYVDLSLVKGHRQQIEETEQKTNKDKKAPLFF
jgi:hypothetical protein